MVLENEFPKKFRFWVLEDLSQDLGFWSIICVISHVTLTKNIASHSILVHIAHWLPPATFFFLNLFNRNEIIIMHTKNDFFSIKI